MQLVCQVPFCVAGKHVVMKWTKPNEWRPIFFLSFKMDVVKMRWGQLEVNQVLDLHETYVLDVSMQKTRLPFH